ncbi:MAG: hypothetical protein ACFFBD_23155 [Candidatus Hodarchaeota archaeon]
MKRIIYPTFISLFILVILFYSQTGVTLEEKPVWLLTTSELPDGWAFDSAFQLDDRFYLNILAPSEEVFSIQTKEFENKTLASSQVTNDLQLCQEVEEVTYDFPNDKVDLTAADEGYVWEIKTLCCLSRGVVFSVETIYLYFSAGRASTWSEIEILYNYQITKILEHFGREVPNNIDPKQLSTGTPSFGTGVTLMALAGMISYLGLKKIAKKQ